MNTQLTPNPSPAPARRPLPWLLILGLASLSLLWPLTALWQIGQGAPRAAVILLVTAAVWVGVVGIGRVPRPVLTLTLTGVLHSLIGLVLGMLIPSGGPMLGLATVWMLIPALMPGTLAGAVLGLVALGVQAVLGPRPGTAAGGRS